MGPIRPDYIHANGNGEPYEQLIQMIGLNLIPTLMNLETMAIELYNS